MSMSIAWLDDDKKFLDSTIPLLEKRGFMIDGFTKPRQFLSEFKKNKLKYSLLLLDLSMPEMDGDDVFDEIKKASCVPSIFVSAYLDDVPWVERLKRFGKKIPTIPKPFPMITSSKYEKIVAKIENIQKVYEEKLKVFQYSYDDFIKLSDRQLDILFYRASEVNSVFVGNYFQNYPTDDWVVIGKSPENVIAHGKSDEEPFEEDLLEMAEKIDCPVFTYSRLVVLEQVETKWSKGEVHKFYYPTLTLEFFSKQKWR